MIILTLMRAIKQNPIIFVLPHRLKLPIPFLIVICLLIIHFHAYPQGKEANIWYFGQNAGVDFNPGSPPSALLNSQMNLYAAGGTGSASIADSTGQLLFYSDGVTIWNKNHVPMQNGENMGHESSQGAMIVPMPDSDHLYYFFNFIWDVNAWQTHFQYSLIDMELDNGYGGVVPDKKNIILFTNSSWHLSAVSHANGRDVWVLAHKYSSDFYYAYRVTKDSVYQTPVISQVGTIFLGNTGYMKISPNGKKVVAALYGGVSSFFDLLDFDNETGVVSDDNIVHKTGGYYGVEFSPDNSKLYTEGGIYLYQYDLNAGSPQDILDSEVLIADLTTGHGALQLGPDGKIYCCLGRSLYLGVIHQPNQLGLACDFEQDAVYLMGRYSNEGLPSFIQSYLNDPAFTTQYHCLGDPTEFEIDNINGIDSVYWDFDDFMSYPNNTSTLFDPVHTFSSADTFEVSLTVYSGLLEKSVIQQVVIHPVPQPDIGNDTLLCDTIFSVELDATCAATTYFWNTWQTTPQITVSDTGIFFVRATNQAGCTGTDSIHIGVSPQPVVNENSLIITPAACAMANGSLTGLMVTGTPPCAYYWVNSLGDTIGNTLDITGLSSDIYTLEVLDGNGCDHMLTSYTVPDNGSLFIDSVLFTHDHCNASRAAIRIYTSSTNQISYSLYGDSAWIQNGGMFTDLASGSYTVMIRDEYGCIGIYDNNPVVIQDIDGPQVTSVAITPDINHQSTGSIHIVANSQGVISYSIYSGNDPQLNNGLFTGLSSGLYTCFVEDEYGCDTTFSAYVPLNHTDTLLAISGFGTSCEGETVVIPIKLFNFNEVYSFDVYLDYDEYIVECDGYLNLNPILEPGFTATVTTNTGEIHLLWQGTAPTAIGDNETLCELVFRGLGEGISPVDWESEPGQSHFYDINLNPIDASYFKGEIAVFSNPRIAAQPRMEICSGDSILITPEIEGGNGTLHYNWSGPDGFVSTYQQLTIPFSKMEEAGTYVLSVEDSMLCSATIGYEVTVVPSPVIAFAEYDTLWVEPGYILEAGYGAETYRWNTGETTESIVIDTMGNYMVEVISSDDCKSTDAVQILWGGIPFYIANAFTPDGDGMNDTFGAIPKYDYINKYHICIFNRWGQKVFETTDIHKGWDGTCQGKPCGPGAYVYRIDYVESGQALLESKVVEGTVMLVR